MTYLYRDATGHLVKVLTDPPTPEAAILAAHRACIAGPVPDDWQTALAAIAERAAQATINGEPPLAALPYVLPKPPCPRCGRPLDNLDPGISIVAGGVAVCTPCCAPGEEIARANGGGM